jgi:hypothetical protein
MNLPFLHRCDQDVVDLSPNKSLYAQEQWRAFAARFVFGALAGRRLWMISDFNRSHAWAFPERFGPPFEIGSLLFVRTADYDLRSLLEAFSTDFESLAFVPDKDYDNKQLFALSEEAFDDYHFYPEPARFEYLRSYGDATGLLWIKPGDGAQRVDALTAQATGVACGEG